MNKQNLFINALAQDAHIQVNNVLINKLGINEAIIIAELVQLQHYFAMRRELNSEGYFYAQYDYMVEDTSLTKNQVVAAIKSLETKNVISTKVTYEQGLKTKWYKVNTLMLDDIKRAYDGSVSLNTDRFDAFTVYNKELAKKIGPAPAVVLSDLYTAYQYTASINNFIDDEWFCVIQRKQAQKLGITRQILVTSYIPILEEAGLISKETRGFQNKTYIKIHFDKLYEYLDYGVASEYTSDSFFITQNIENLSGPEKVTRALIAHAEEISGIKWDFDFYKVSCIEEVLKEGYTEEQLIKIIDHLYKYYKEQDKLDKMFNFSNIVGQPSKVKTWLKKIDTDGAKEEEYLKAEKVAYTLYNKMLEHSNGEIKYEIDANKITMIRKRLAEGLTEEELVEHMISRYDFLVKAGYNVKKNTSFNKLFGTQCFDDIQKVRNNKNRASYNPQTKKFKLRGASGADPNSRDGVRSKPYTKSQIEEFKRKADELEAAGEIGYF